MQTGILVTNGGPHSPEDWAYASASMMLEAVKVDPNSPNRVALEMAKDAVRPKVAEVLSKHHDAVQSTERKKLAAGDHERLMAKLDAAEHTDVEKAIADCHALVAPILQKAMLFSGGDASNDATTINDHLERLIRQRIEIDLKTSMHIERSGHADRNPNTEHAVAFKAAFHTAGV